jgi:TPR repeat protein
MLVSAALAACVVGYVAGLTFSAHFAWQLPEKLLLAHKGVKSSPLMLTLASAVTAWLPIAFLGHLSLRFHSSMQGMKAKSAQSGLRAGIVYGMPIIAFAASFAVSSSSPHWQIEKIVSAALRQSANAGDADAQNKLGWRYSNGVGAMRSRAEAVYWWEKSAAQGFAKAQYNLGLSYGSGQGVIASKAEAAKWVALAAEQGFDQAQLALGNMYLSGTGVEQSYSKSFELFSSAGKRGNARAFFALGNMRKAGQGAAASLAEARNYYLKAAALDFEPAQEALKSLEASASVNLRTSVSAN